MRRVALALTVVTLVAGPVFGQTSLSGTIGPGVSSVAADAGGGLDFRASGDLEHRFASERGRVFYELETGDYASEGDWRFLAHRGGGSYQFDLGGPSRHRLYIGGDGTFRRNGQSWSAADFDAAGAFANLELTPRTGVNIRSGYRLDVRRFSSAPGMNQAQHSIFGSILLNFRTRTTLIGQFTAGAKHYEAVSPTTDVIAVPTEGVPAAAQHGGSGRGGGLGGASLVPVIVPGAPGSDARQITMLARVAQSLASRTGLSLEVSRRRVDGEVSPAMVATPAEFFDDGIYDDLFASDADRASMTLKTVVGHGIEMSATAAWLEKRYGSTTAFDAGGVPLSGVLRRDRVSLARFDATWPLFPSRTGAVALDLVTGYDYTRHRSTSVLYDYSGHAVRVSVAIGY